MIDRKFEKTTEKEIAERKKMYQDAEALGIDLMSYDGDQSEEERRDIRKAVILLGAGKEVPEDLRQRLLSRKQTA